MLWSIRELVSGVRNLGSSKHSDDMVREEVKRGEKQLFGEMGYISHKIQSGRQIVPDVSHI